MKYAVLTLYLFSTWALMGCSGGPSSSNPNARGGAQSGELTLSITDAAVDDAIAVWVQFNSIELKPAEGSSITYTFDSPISINLLSLQGSLSQDFFNNIVVPSGTYNWIRLDVNTAGDMDSYIEMNDGVHELTIPSGSQSGLKISDEFIIAANSQSAMTIDFDLRKSIVMASGEYKLKPVLRLVNNENAGTLTGSIDAGLTTGLDCSDADPETGNAVYVFTGFDAVLDDIDNSSFEPITTALISLNTETGFYDYEVGFLPEGNYTVAYTCMADSDDPEQDDIIVFKSSVNQAVDIPVDLNGADINR